MLNRKVVVPIAVPQQGVTLFGDVRGGVGQSLHQAHANHKRGFFVGWLLATHIHHGCLDTAGNDGSRVKQGAIPVKSNQIKPFLCHVGRRIGAVNEEN